MKFKLFDSAATVLGSMIFLATAPALAITVDPFPATGQGGEINGQYFKVGRGGQVFELEGYVSAAGDDLNGGFDGTSGQLGVDALRNFDIAFSAELSDGDTDITLSYAITKTGGAAQEVSFLSFLDAEIDVFLNDDNTWFDELATTGGVLAAGQGYEIDEPGVVFGDILDNVFSGVLDNGSGLGRPEDVSMALSFELGMMDIGDSAIVDIMISEDGDFLGTFWMTQTDAYPITGTEITYSGLVSSEGSEPGSEPGNEPGNEPSGDPQSAIPEPSSALVFALGALVTSGAIRRRR